VNKKYSISSKSISDVKVDHTYLQKDANLPIVINNTKDYFAFDLHTETINITDPSSGKTFKKSMFYFYPWNLPENYGKFMTKEAKEKIKSSQKEANNPINYPVGAHCYENFFTNEEMNGFEKDINDTEELCKDDVFLPNTA